MSGREKNALFRAHNISRKHYKNSGFSGNWPKHKNDTFLLKKVFFDMGEKVGFTNCVCEKLCSSENTILTVFSEKTQPLQ